MCSTADFITGKLPHNSAKAVCQCPKAVQLTSAATSFAAFQKKRQMANAYT
jgi:hypothetical protein